jgi:diguanylate cyclase (GGDEF)-like protein/hemerythrin-like metal-binding protein/PAS domain S-box-containing protein
MIDNEIDFFEIFPWNSNFETGINLIDEQHKQLVNILNKLAAHLANLSDSIILNEIFDELADYADYHFKTEEQIWKKYFKDDIWILNHKETHKSFISEVIELKDNKDNKPLDDVIHDIVSFLSQWLAYHILDNDKRMSKVILALESGESLEASKKISDNHMNGSMKLLVGTVLTMYDSLSSRTLDLMREKTLRKKAEKALSLSEERWKVILDGGLEDVWDFKLKYSLVNHDSILETFTKNIIKNKKYVTIYPHDLELIQKNLIEHFEGKKEIFICKYRLLKDDNTWLWVLSRGKVVSKTIDGVFRLVGTNSDVTELELASIIYKNSSQAMFVSDAYNNIISVNAAFTKITGYEEIDVIGENPTILSSNDNEKIIYEKMWKDINKKDSWSGELINKKKNGDIYIEYLNINVVRDEKGYLDHYVALFTDITEKKSSEDIIKKQATYDFLTQLYNRNMFQIQLEEEIVKFSRTKLPFALLFIDLDHFKDVNDTLGHDIGDKVLIEASRRILLNIRKTDFLGRFGGDEFTIILPELKNINIIDNIADKIIKSLTLPFFIDLKQIHISASVGITIYPNDASDAVSLLKNADQAMYGAKKLGRRQFNYYTQKMQDEAQRRQDLLSGLYSSVELNQLELYYQPIIDLDSKEIRKAEALLRWNHPLYGIIYPGEFITLLEYSGLIIKVGDWIYEEVLKQIKKWKVKYNIELQISINKSPVQFKSIDSMRNWKYLLDKYGLSGKNICIEITENLLMESEDIVINKLLDYRNNGVDISIDDFGTGYSSLSYLKKFDIDYIKIDQSFVRNLTEDSQDMILCEAMIAMAHKLNINVIAEGIEEKNQMSLLKDINCDYGQGYLFSKPVKSCEFEKLFLEEYL